MKNFGDKVVYVRNGETINAIVVQSTQEADGEHLVLIYADPAMRAVLIQQMNKVVATAFGVSAFRDGQNCGWRESKDAGESQDYKQLVATLNAELVARDKVITDLRLGLAKSEGDSAEWEHQLAKAKDTIAQLEGDKAELDHQLAKKVDELAAKTGETPQLPIDTAH